MPVIASHHARDPWRPLLGWPESTRVQWGGRGIVLGRPGTTAFFEAFPKDGSAGFIRGEGTTVEEAEQDAFKRWTKQSACFQGIGHLWTRTPRRKYQRGKPLGSYTNRGGFCLRCGGFETVMLPIVKLGGWCEPLDAMELDGLASGFNRLNTPGDSNSAKYNRKTLLKARRMGIRIPDPVPPAPGVSPFAPDDYTRACRRGMRDWLLEQKSVPTVVAGSRMEALFSSMSSGILESLMSENGEEEDE